MGHLDFHIPNNHSRGKYTMYSFFFAVEYIYWKNKVRDQRLVMRFREDYRKNPKILETQKFAVISLKVGQGGIFWEKYFGNMQGELQSVDPDQTAPLQAVWSGFTLFAQNCLSENLGTVR